MGGFFGIDLGTTFCSCAFIRDEYANPQIVDIDRQSGLESVVWLTNGEQEDIFAYVGDKALLHCENLSDDDGLLIRGSKRTIGVELSKFSVNPPWKFGKYQLDSTTVAAIILKKIKQSIDRIFPNDPLTKAVITHPAYFLLPQKHATMEAARLAGIEVIDTITEPAAAAIAFGLGNKDPGLYMVFDLGGGTLDVTVLELEPGKIRMRTHEGDSYLGGLDWDKIILEKAKSAWEAKYEGRLANQCIVGNVEQNWLTQARRQKQALSELKVNTTHYSVTTSTGDETVTLPLSRSEFENSSQKLVRRALEKAESVLRNAGIGWSDLKGTLLVGGSTRMPMIVEALEQKGAKPLRKVDPDLAVAFGAAYRARELLLNRALELDEQKVVSAPEVAANPIQSKVQDCVSRTLRILVDHCGQEICQEIIPQNTPIPCKKEEIFTLKYDNMHDLPIKLYEGESENPRFCSFVGLILITDIPQGSAGDSIKVVFSYSEGSCLHVLVEFLRQKVSREVIFEYSSMGAKNQDNHGASITNSSREDILSVIQVM